MEPFELNYNNAETGGVHTSCPVSCVELVVNKYYQGNYVDTQAYNFTSTYISSLSLAGLGVPTAGHVKYFAMNVSDPSWAGENRTVAFNWFVSGGLFSPSDSSEGLMILLPDFTGYNNLFDTSYYGHGINEPGDGRLSGETEIEIDVYLKDEALKHKGAFVSHPSYDITLPELDTKAENVRADYTGLL